LKKAKPGQTISIFGLFRSETKDSSPPKASTTKPQTGQKVLQKAPRGVPTISNWERNRDGSISGFIKGSFSFGEGEAVTTSPVRGNVAGGTVVVTASGSNYFLEPQGAVSTASSADNERDERAKQAAAAAEARKQQAAEAEAQRAAAAQARREEAEAKRLAAAQERQRQEEERKAAAQIKREELEAKRAEAALKKAKPGQTISIFGLFRSETKDSSPPKASTTKPQTGQKVLQKAPRGVPTISNWERNRDGSISGFIKGSFSFGEGEAVTTSPVRGNVAGGTVVETASGSKYFLDLSSASSSSTTSMKSPKLKQAPRGVPSVAKWKKNRDGSITGLVSGSPNFEEGERITSSPITSGVFDSGEVVQTGSGSKYFLV